MKKYVWTSASIGSLLLIGTLVASPAMAATDPVDIEPANPAPLVVGTIDPDDPMIFAPGSALAPEGLSASLLGTSRCGSSAYAPPGGGQGPDSRASCSLAGSPGFRTGYTWQMQSGSSTRVCASGLGYNAAYAPVWFGVGCGGSGAVNVPWGNVLAYQKLHAYSINGYGGNVNWY